METYFRVRQQYPGVLSTQSFTLWCAISRCYLYVPQAVPLSMCHPICVMRGFGTSLWVIHCFPQVSEYMRTIATLPLVTASLILGQEPTPQVASKAATPASSRPVAG